MTEKQATKELAVGVGVKSGVNKIKENPMNTVPENEVLIACAKHLFEKHGVVPFQVSVASGRGLDSRKSQEDLTKSLSELDLPVDLLRFVNTGPDLIGISKGSLWQVECKGAGMGKPQTQRNSFDRVLASVTSHL